MKCPNCGLVNAPTAERCDCGFSFVGAFDQRRDRFAIADAHLRNPRLVLELVILVPPLFCILCLAAFFAAKWRGADHLVTAALFMAKLGTVVVAAVLFALCVYAGRLALAFASVAYMGMVVLVTWAVAAFLFMIAFGMH